MSSWHVQLVADVWPHIVIRLYAAEKSKFPNEDWCPRVVEAETVNVVDYLTEGVAVN